MSCLRQPSHISPTHLQSLRPRFSSHLRTSTHCIRIHHCRLRGDFVMSESQSSPNHSNRDHLRERVRLRQKRKTTSCWPCRDRKVKCDKGQPCQICVKRGYSDLCTYESPSVHHASAIPPPPAQPGDDLLRARTISGVESRPGTGYRTSISSVTERSREPFLGENAIPSFARDHANPGDGTSTRQNVEAGFMPIIGHENNDSADDFLPVMADTSNIHEGLPSDRDIIKSVIQESINSGQRQC